ncbi:MAG: adenylosuccinate lyase [Deltaproteobacteria bacterium]|nr:adenylosuccinate lyase [Deltaproteobacteria bacterium]
MISRYTPQDFEALWSAASRFDAWLAVELAACDAMESTGWVPAGTAERIRARNLRLDPERIEAIERTTKHDVIAFLTHVEELAGPDARWLHFGMTSSDVLDTSFAMLLVRAADLITARLDRLIEVLARRTDEHRRTVTIGRSHGIHAEPLRFGMVLAGHLAELKRGRLRVRTARAEIAVGKLAGAVGSYAHLSPDLEAQALATLGLVPETVSTQVVARDRHAAFFGALALVAAGIERLATNVRHWQRTEVAEAEEAFTRGQKGSSAMPHKRNPILSENLCGLARIVRAAVVPALEDVALWHERDISHSSVERMIAPDATATLAFMLERAAGLCDGLVVYPEAMRKNLDLSGGRCFSEGVLLALVQKGLARQDAYVLVQRSAMRSFEGAGEFQTLLADDPEVSALLSAAELARCFDLEHALRYADAVIDRALEAP